MMNETVQKEPDRVENVVGGTDSGNDGNRYMYPIWWLLKITSYGFAKYEVASSHIRYKVPLRLVFSASISLKHLVLFSNSTMPSCICDFVSKLKLSCDFMRLMHVIAFCRCSAHLPLA